MHYKVKVKVGKNTTPDGYLSNWVDNELPALYPLSEAKRKAKMFSGTIEAVLNTKDNKNTTMTIMSGKSIHLVIRTLLIGKELFKHKNDFNTFIYDSFVFIDLKQEFDELEKNEDFKTKIEIKEQLNELSQVVEGDYILINDMCFS